ncbi:MAG TPA: recombinase family protein [Vicinamibacterales bacterium]|jgi:DNA invertase Pin-like site-specific DNA recombinase|nr:recombinase family protein [Vicinamibacterales bacterium]
MRAAVYARVSTVDQEPENQLQELRRYVGARGWTAAEYVDRGVSGAKDRRPVLDQLLDDAKRRRFDVVVCWRLDRLQRVDGLPADAAAERLGVSQSTVKRWRRRRIGHADAPEEGTRHPGRSGLHHS